MRQRGITFKLEKVWYVEKDYPIFAVKTGIVGFGSEKTKKFICVNSIILKLINSKKKLRFVSVIIL